MYDYSFRTTGEKIWRNSLVDDSELVFLAIFTLEAVIKIIGMGFVMDRRTYIRDPWNILDFIVVVFGWMSFIPGIVGLSGLRSIRILRPLRSVNAVKGMKILVLSLFRSLPGLFNVVLFLGFIFAVFSIIGVNSLQGLTYSRCRYSSEPENGEIWHADPDIVRICTMDNTGNHNWPDDRYCGIPGDHWLFNYDYYKETEIEELDWGILSFDNLGSALITVFQIVTLEGWTKLMYNYYDATSPLYVSVFLTLIVLLGSFFLLNLMLAAISISYNFIQQQEDAKKEEEAFETQKETPEWDNATPDPVTNFPADRQSVMPDRFEDVDSHESFHSEALADENFEYTSPRTLQRVKFAYMGQPRKAIYLFVEHKVFLWFITVCILLNTVFLATDRYPIDEESVKTIEYANLTFYCIFVIEMILKLIGLGIRGYCADRFNIFDGVIVILSTIEVILFYSGTSGPSTGGAISAFRALRLLRVLKLARSWVALQKILETMTRTLSSISYFSILMTLFIIIYALLGMEFFAHKLKFDDDHMPDPDGRAPRVNFDGFFHAFECIFIVLVGDDWQNIMYDAIRTQGYSISLIYFISLIVLGNWILLNLFLAMLMDKFERDDEPHDVALADPDKETEQDVKDKKEKVKSRTTQPFLKENLMGKALFIFGPTNAIRLFTHKIFSWKHFDNVILVIIIISSILLAIDNPLNDPDGDMSYVLGIWDMILTAIFTLEMIIKVLTLGFIGWGPTSYIRNGWNILDFGIVIISLISLGLTGGSLNMLKALRTIRVLRPLRLISRNQNLKLVIDSLIRSVPSIGNVMLVSMFFYVIISIICVNFFKGEFFYCDREHLSDQLQDYEIDTKQDWIDYGGAWINKDSNFDNVGVGVLSLLIISTTEGWVEISHSGVDAVGIDKNPKFENEFGWAYFFMFFILFGGFFIISLIAIVVFEQFFMEQKEGQTLTPAQEEYVLMQKYCLNSRPLIRKKEPEDAISKLCYYLVGRLWFDYFIISCIICNSIVLGLRWYSQTSEDILIIESVNLFFTVVFLIEAVMKILAWRRSYFKEGWNRFDFFIVVISVIELVITAFYEFALLMIITLFRIFRIGRVLRLVKRAEGLRVILTTFIITLPQVANIGALLLLFMYIYTILGVQLFAKVQIQGALNYYANFQEFWKAFMLMIRASSGEAWNEIMYATALEDGVLINCINDPTYEEIQANGGEPNGCGTPASYLFFISFIVIVIFMFLNIFIAALLRGFEEAKALESGMLKGQDYLDFRERWQKYDPDGTWFIEAKNLDKLLWKLPPPLGWKGRPSLRNSIVQAIIQADIPAIKSDYFHFYEVANALFKKVYGAGMPQNQNLESNAKPFLQIKKAAERIYSLSQQESKISSKQIMSLINWTKRWKSIMQLRRSETEKQVSKLPINHQYETAPIFSERKSSERVAAQLDVSDSVEVINVSRSRSIDSKEDLILGHSASQSEPDEFDQSAFDLLIQPAQSLQPESSSSSSNDPESQDQGNIFDDEDPPPPSSAGKYKIVPIVDEHEYQD